MRFFIIVFLFQINNSTAALPPPVDKIPQKQHTGPSSHAPDNKHAEPPDIATKPVNNDEIIKPFPVENVAETIWNKKLEEYIYAYQIRYGNIGDKFILPEDMEEFLKTLPHGTDDKPIASIEQQNKIATIFDEDYQQNIVDQYFKMQYRILAPTMR